MFSGDHQGLKKSSESQREQNMQARILPAGRLVQTRRQYRAAHVSRIEDIMSLCTHNVQGLCWSRLDNKLKLQRLVSDARDNGWHCTFLSDLHTADAAAPALEILCIEEFVMIARGRVGFLISQCMLKLWEGSGRQTVYTSDSDRLLAIIFQHNGRKNVFGTGYCSTQSKDHDRKMFFKAFGKLETECRESDVQV